MHPSGDVCMRVHTQNVHLYYLGIYFPPSTKAIKDNRKLKAKESWLEVGEKLPPPTHTPSPYFISHGW